MPIRTGPLLFCAFVVVAVVPAQEHAQVPERGSVAVPDPQHHAETSSSLHERFEHAHGEFLERREKFDPKIELRLRALPNARVGEEPGSFDMYGFDFDAEREIPVALPAYLLLGVYHHQRHYDPSSDFGTFGNSGALDDTTLTGTGLRLGFGWFASDDVLVEFEANPGLFNDRASRLYGKSFDCPTSLLVNVRTAPGFFLKAGVRYNRIFESEPILPYLGFAWEFAEGFRLDVLAPEEFELSWWPTAGTGLRIGVFAAGAEYHVSSSTASGTQRADVQVEEVVAYVGLTQRFDERFSLAARAGMTVTGGYDLTDGTAGFDRIEGELGQTFYADVTFGLAW